MHFYTQKCHLRQSPLSKYSFLSPYHNIVFVFVARPQERDNPLCPHHCHAYRARAYPDPLATPISLLLLLLYSPTAWNNVFTVNAARRRHRLRVQVPREIRIIII